ncbi:hypothetical protein FACS1894201_01260 [Bacteroidia bacterium]|nr:hypothetical protein FACS1894201_01260 [Bacteroidia bacterium]
MVITTISCVKDKPITPPEMTDSPVKLNEAYSNGDRSTYGAIDWVELYNNSGEAVDISGYMLYDKADKIEKVIVPVGTILAARGFFTIDVDVVGGFGLSSGGDMVYMEDNAGNLIDQIEFGALTPEQSYARNPDGSDTFKIQTPTPGISNNGAVVAPSVTNVAHTPVSPTNNEDVVISATVTAGEGTVSSVKLKWTLNTTAQTDITMTNSGDVYSATITRQAANAVIAYSVEALNSVGGTTTTSSGTYTVRDAAVVDYTGLVINEVDGNGKFVELYNKSAAAISLAGVTLVKNETGTWWTGGAVSIAAGGFYTIAQTGQTPTGVSESTGNGGISSKQNLKFELKQPDVTTVIDQFLRTNGTALGDAVTPAYDATTPRYSFSRCPDGGAFGLAVPSCNAANPTLPVGPIATDGSTVDYTQLVINEIDGNGKFVEIYNNGAVAVSLTNITLYKNETTLWWTGGAVSIAAGGFYTIAQTGQTPAGVSESTGNGGISPKKTVKFEMRAPNGFYIDAYARLKADGILDADCTPDYGSGTKYSFSRCPDGLGTFGLAVPSCNVANPATAVGAIVTN